MRRRIVIHNHLPSRDAIKSGAFYENNRHPMAVSREEEERHRDESYARTGITRVGRDEGEKKWTMGTYCEHCGCKAGSHQQGTMNCPKNGPGSGFNPSQKFSPVKGG